jgi:hypothetical protein
MEKHRFNTRQFATQCILALLVGGGMALTPTLIAQAKSLSQSPNPTTAPNLCGLPLVCQESGGQFDVEGQVNTGIALGLLGTPGCTELDPLDGSSPDSELRVSFPEDTKHNVTICNKEILASDLAGILRFAGSQVSNQNKTTIGKTPDDQSDPTATPSPTPPPSDPQPETQGTNGKEDNQNLINVVGALVAGGLISFLIWATRDKKTNKNDKKTSDQEKDTITTIREHVEKDLPEADLDDILVSLKDRGRVKILVIGSIRRRIKITGRNIEIPKDERDGD